MAEDGCERCSRRSRPTDEGPLSAIVAFTIFASTVIHGLNATATVEVLDREYAEGGGFEPDPGEEIPKNV